MFIFISFSPPILVFPIPHILTTHLKFLISSMIIVVKEKEKERKSLLNLFIVIHMYIYLGLIS